MSRKLFLGLAVLVALLFLVAPSLARLAFLMDPPVATEPTDRAFVEHRAIGMLHVAPGLFMVALMPVQASAGIRRRWPALHRWAGRLFIVTGLSVTVTAVAMNVLFPVVGGLAKLSVICVMCIAEAVALTAGLRAILRRDVAAHRRWMIRAMGVAFSGGTAGLFVVPFYATGTLDDTVIGVGRWLGFITTMVAVEVWLRGKPSSDRPRRQSPIPGAQATSA